MPRFSSRLGYRWRRASVALCLAAGLAAASPAHGAGTLRVGNEAEPESMDPHFITTVQNSRIFDDMFLTLTTPGPDGAAIAGAADRWAISEDGLTYTFTIRDHAWSDGTPVTASDFEYGMKRLLNPKTGSQYASLLFIIKGARAYNGGEGSAADVAVRALDDRTLRITLTHPAPYFLSQLTHQTAAPLPRHVVEKYGAQWTKPEHIVVNGAFKLAEWLPNTRVRLVKNPAFYDAANVALNEVEYYTYEDRTAMQKRFRAGGLDAVRDIASEQIGWLRKNLPEALRIVPYEGIYFYMANVRKPPFDDARVRRALAMAIDVDAIANKVLRTGELPAYSFVPPGVSNYGQPSTVAWKGRPYRERVAIAKRLLAEAGYGPDNPLAFTLRYNTSENHKRIAIAIAAMWKKLGARAELFKTDSKGYYASLRAGDFQIARYGWIADYDDAQNFLFKLDGRTGEMNESGYDNPEFNALMQKAAATLDLKARAKILRRAEAQAMRDLPVMPIYYYVSKQLVSPRVEGWVDNTVDKHPSRFLSLKSALSLKR
nr:peptide ABC transporter substrate-binding protein [uncultured Brevundimonas sp.]